jgi:hypothetical protein
MFLMQALAFCLEQAAILAGEREPLNCTGEFPQEAADGRLGDATVVVGAGFVAERVEVVRRLVAEDE